MTLDWGKSQELESKEVLSRIRKAAGCQHVLGVTPLKTGRVELFHGDHHIEFERSERAELEVAQWIKLVHDYDEDEDER